MITFQNISQFSFIEHGITEIGDIPPEHLAQGEQTHKTGAAWVTSDSPQLPVLIPDVDTLATKEAGVGISVRVADCVPIFLVEPRKKIVAVVHAGWRGTALNISRKSVDWLRETAGVQAQQLIVAMGPAIGPEDFVVGAEVARQFSPSVVKPAASAEDEEKFHVDLWQANIDQLVDAGVLIKNIEVIKRSTYADEKLYSARRGNREERNIAWIKIK